MNRLMTIAVLIGVLIVIQFGCQHRADESRVVDSISVNRLVPEPSISQAKVKSGHQQEFVFKLDNNVAGQLDNLHIDIGCQCQVTRQVPPSLAKGETCEFAFTIRAPTVGFNHEVVSLMSGQKVLWRYDATVGALADAPLMISALTGEKLTFVENANTTKTLKVLTLEHKSSTPWITGATVPSSSEVTVERINVKDTDNTVDGEALVQRSYEIAIQSTISEYGNQKFTVHFLTEPTTKDAMQMPLVIETLRSIELIPAKIEFGSRGSIPSEIPSQRVTLINRIPTSLKNVSIDPPQSFEIERLSDQSELRVSHFRVTYLADSSTTIRPHNARIIFETIDDRKIDLPIFFHQ